MYGCELWLLHDSNIEVFCVAWRKALRRILGLPQNAHSYLLPIVSNSWPIFDEICKRSSHFILSCLSSPSPLVRWLSWHSVAISKFNSVLGANAQFCCERFGWPTTEFFIQSVIHNNRFFYHHFSHQESNVELDTAMLLLETIFVKDKSLFLPPDFFVNNELNDIIDYVATC